MIIFEPRYPMTTLAVTTRSLIGLKENFRRGLVPFEIYVELLAKLTERKAQLEDEERERS